MLDYGTMNVTKAKWGEMPMTKRERELTAQVKHLTSVINELVRRLDETKAGAVLRSLSERLAGESPLLRLWNRDGPATVPPALLENRHMGASRSDTRTGAGGD